ncbi:GDP-mannose 4,6-dehydratase, partial [Candidatus Curtissbacteria bacterium RBG_16_39_7]
NPNVSHIEGKINLEVCDLLDKDKVLQVIAKTKPDLIFHLAGFTIPRLSYGQPEEAFKINVFGQINIFEALKILKLPTKILIVGSSEEYGIVKNPKKPVNEETPLNPVSPYAVSKIAQDFCGLSYFHTHKIPIIRIRPFPHLGPRLDERLAISSFAKQIVLIEKGMQEKIIKVGNLEAKRDFTDVRDMVHAYFLASEKCKPGEVYNIGSGKSYSLSQMLGILLSLAKVEIKIEKDPDRFRPVDVPEIICDAGKFRKITGWKPKVKIRETLKDILNY